MKYLRRYRWSTRSWLAQFPSVYLPLARRRYPNAVVEDSTELVIDGFTRSAVTFAVISFQMAQTRSVRVAHTLHAPAHLLAAAEREIPCLVTVRDPDEVVASAVIREPYITPRQAFEAYGRFYWRLEPIRRRLLVVEFGEVTTDYGAVIRRLNEKFGTRFDQFEHKEANVSECFQIIEDRSRRPPWSTALGELECGLIGIKEYRRVVESYRERGLKVASPIPENRVPRPSAQRTKDKHRLRAELHHPRLRAVRSRAYAAYDMFLAKDD